MKNYILYNPLSGGGKGQDAARAVSEKLEGETVMTDLTAITDYKAFLDSCAGERVVVCGGDGTLNRFVNLTQEIDIPNKILYFPVGSGNDFARDLGKRYGDDPFPISDYIKNLPSVTVKNKTCRFLNGIGFGLDGYCAQEGDEFRKGSDDPPD